MVRPFIAVGVSREFGQSTSAAPRSTAMKSAIPPEESGPLRRRPRQVRAQERIERLLDTAEQVFADVGYDGATTNLIAHRAGTSIGSLYEFFPNKEAIARALADRYVTQIGGIYDSEIVDAPGVVGDAIVERVVAALDRFYREHPGAIPLLNGRFSSPDLAEAGEQLQHALVRQVERVLAARAPTVPAVKRHLVATIVAEVARSLLVLADQSPLSQRRAVVNETVKVIVGYLLRTLGEPGPVDHGPTPGHGGTPGN